MFGVNANKILNKIYSFDIWVKEKEPAIFCIHEKKVPAIGQIKTTTTNKYQLYEQIRSVNPGMGVGLCIGIKKELPSTLIREGGEDAECLTVQVEVGQQELVMVCGYGPRKTPAWRGRRSSGSTWRGRWRRRPGRSRCWSYR